MSVGGAQIRTQKVVGFTKVAEDLVRGDSRPDVKRNQRLQGREKVNFRIPIHRVTTMDKLYSRYRGRVGGPVRRRSSLSGCGTFSRRVQ
jgi:hypothetical protein